MMMKSFGFDREFEKERCDKRICEQDTNREGWNNKESRKDFGDNE